jgi:hypothetical protein
MEFLLIVISILVGATAMALTRVWSSPDWSRAYNVSRRYNKRLMGKAAHKALSKNAYKYFASLAMAEAEEVRKEQCVALAARQSERAARRKANRAAKRLSGVAAAAKLRSKAAKAKSTEARASFLAFVEKESLNSAKERAAKAAQVAEAKSAKLAAVKARIGNAREEQRRRALARRFFHFVHRGSFALVGLNEETVSAIASTYCLPVGLVWSMGLKFNIGLRNQAAQRAYVKRMVA